MKEKISQHNDTYVTHKINTYICLNRVVRTLTIITIIAITLFNGRINVYISKIINKRKNNTSIWRYSTKNI